MEQLHLQAESPLNPVDYVNGTLGMTPQPSPLPNTTRSLAPGLTYKSLGKSGLKVSNLGLATWMLGNESPETLESVVTLAYDSGINVFDLSDAYSGHSCESELGKILKRRNWRRTSYVILVKIYWTSKCEERALSRKYIVDSVKKSLERLGLDFIDVVIIHRADSTCPMEEIVRAMTHVISNGWAMYWGTSKWTPVEIMEAYSNCRQFNCITPILEQAEYHFFCRDKAELYMSELYNKIGVGLMTFNPVTMNFQKLFGGNTSEDALTFTFRTSFRKKYSSSCSWSNEEEGMSSKEPPWNRSLSVEDGSNQKVLQQKKICREVEAVAERHGVSLAQLSIAWCLKNAAVQCTLVGPISTQELISYLQALQLTSKLGPSVMLELEKMLDNRPARPPAISTLSAAQR